MVVMLRQFVWLVLKVVISCGVVMDMVRLVSVWFMVWVDISELCFLMFWVMLFDSVVCVMEQMVSSSDCVISSMVSRFMCMVRGSVCSGMNSSMRNIGSMVIFSVSRLLWLFMCWVVVFVCWLIQGFSIMLVSFGMVSSMLVVVGGILVNFVRQNRNSSGIVLKFSDVFSVFVLKFSFSSWGCWMFLNMGGYFLQCQIVGVGGVQCEDLFVCGVVQVQCVVYGQVWVYVQQQVGVGQQGFEFVDGMVVEVGYLDGIGGFDVNCDVCCQFVIVLLVGEWCQGLCGFCWWVDVFVLVCVVLFVYVNVGDLVLCVVYGVELYGDD